MSHRHHSFYPPVAGRASRWPATIVLGISAVLLLLGVVVLSFTLPDHPDAEGGFALLFYGSIFFFVGMFLYGSWFRVQRKMRAWVNAGASLGLSYSPRVSLDDLDPYQGLMLFRHADDFTPWAGNLLHGEIDGREWLILEFGYVGHRFGEEGERYGRTTFRQTIALVADIGDVPDFLLQPRSSEWHMVTWGWAERLKAGPRVCVVRGREKADVRSRQRDATDDFFTPSREDFFARLPGWTVETWRGHLLVYREDLVIEAQEVEPLAEVVRDVVLELTRAEAPVRRGGKADEDSEDGHVFDKQE